MARSKPSPGRAAKARPASAARTAAEVVDDPPIEAPAGSDLVIANRHDRHDVLAVIDRHDEAMIVDELQSRALKVMLYSYSQGGQEITDLSYLGVNEAVRVMNTTRKWRITIDPASLVVVEVQDDLGAGVEPCYQATVYAVDKASDYGQFGTYTQPKRMKLKDAGAITRAKKRGDHVDNDGRIGDKFSRQKAINKAQRNGLRIHIPEKVRQTLIAQYRGDPEAIRKIEAGPGAAELAKLPPPLQDAQADNQRAEIRSLYDQLKEINAIALLPAQFHAYLTRAEHDHDKLQDFIEYLRDHISKETEKARKANAGAS